MAQNEKSHGACTHGFFRFKAKECLGTGDYNNRSNKSYLIF
jgi:hypothetical protein